jgi:DNA-binding response OmpR family regulator
MSKYLILIVEDERAVARGLEYGLQLEGFAVLWAQTGQAALDLALHKNPHLILLDIRLPDLNGFDVCRKLREAGLRQPIIMITARDDEVDRVLGLELGADDYIVKPYSLRELIARIRASLRRSYGMLSQVDDEDPVQRAQINIDLERLQVFRKGKRVELTPIEFRLFKYLFNHPNRPFTREDLIQSVWGYDSIIGNERTVDVHIRHLREKLEEDPAKPRWLLTVRGVGYKFQPN